MIGVHDSLLSKQIILCLYCKPIILYLYCWCLVKKSEFAEGPLHPTKHNGKREKRDGMNLMSINVVGPPLLWY